MSARPTLLLALLVCVPACSCDEMPPIDETFDGNIVVGDATPAPDAEPRDRGTADGETMDGADAASSDGDSGPLPDANGEDADVDAAIDCDVEAVAVLTASAAAAQAGVLAGMIVDVTGTATVSALSCTDLACPPEDPCCNTCVADVSVDGRVRLLASECFASAPGCNGTECAQVCRPPVLGLPQVFRGRITTSTSGAGLELFSVSP